MNNPDYKKIFKDIIQYQYPHKAKACESILNKESLTGIDVITLNNLIFESRCQEPAVFNQKHHFYDKQSIMQILEYQKKHNLNNTQVAQKYKLSRNTVAKWKKLSLNQNN
ncbi:helix-turn-helix domain-containing protein [Chryseobacterium indologenes]|uniref:helix-turn-helix domain-containing protein n=1 Tax=Chryseobacterium indologenes TaxID=253 RepID=UPI001BD1784E|nr:helix-turn-helix domain-containing protein [Chryseobacterium indologenes]